MMRNSRTVLFALVLIAMLLVPAQKAFAKDDFGRIVHHIEAQYHVHRQHRFVIGMAGFVVKFWHVAGIKNLKAAIFENQPFANSAADTRFDELVRAAMDSGWQPVVQSWDRHTGERTYVYAQEVSSKKGSDMKVLVVNLESNEAAVLQVKVDPKKLNDFIEETMPDKRRHGHPSPGEEVQPRTDVKVELAQAGSQSWDGICLFMQEEPQPVKEP